ncbi:MAG: SGNH/GDSL hydrolase family protein [Ruminococcaceae bacterium]|nr:SGNH/GDSL hydrolase family protein [Oscillospiraceae bacterium]
MSQIEKNSVSSKNQLKKSQFVSYVQEEGTGLRVLFVGNSITRHGVLSEIGWHWDWGMAASALEKDYVHLLVEKIKKTNPDACFCICQGAEWERNYKNGSQYLEPYEAARDFGADLIIFRLIENCPCQEFDSDAFYQEYQNLIDYLDAGKKAKIILTTGFWKHPGDDTIMRVAEEREYPCVYLGELGEKDEMKAIGLFEHTGVANHPGDLGMQAIADMIAEKL